MEQLVEQALETWRIQDRIHRYLLAGIAEEAMGAEPKPKGRSVAAQFGHIHNVRKMWLASGAPDLDAGLKKWEAGVSSRKELAEYLEASGKAVEELLRRGLESGKVKGFKPHAMAFLGYLTAHEAHHRGQILLTLKQNGMLPEKKILFGIWEWGVR